MPVLFELQYNPPAGFFAELCHQDALWLESHEHYHKQTFRNRCLILTAQGVQPLTIPVVAGNRREKLPIRDVEIDYRQNWVHRHWRTLQTAYGGSPYFAYYADYLHDIYVQKTPLLFDLNLALLHFFLRCLRLRIPVEFTADFHHTYPPTAVRDRRDWLTPKAAQPAEPDRTSVRPYAQLFGASFVPELSILDLLFMQGPAAGRFLV